MIKTLLAAFCLGVCVGLRSQIPTLSSVSVTALSSSARWETLVDGASFNSLSDLTNQWSYNYPEGPDHNGSAWMKPTNVSVLSGLVILTSSPTNEYEGFSGKPPHCCQNQWFGHRDY